MRNVGELKPVPDGLRRWQDAGRGRLPFVQIPSGSRPPASIAVHVRASSSRCAEEAHVSRRRLSGSRREFLLLPPLAVGASHLLSVAAARAEEKAPESPVSGGALEEEEEKKKKEEEKKEKEAEIASRVYDASAIGEPRAVGKDKKKVWEKLLGARVVYLGEAEQVPDKDDMALELEIVRNLRNRCFEEQRPVYVALEAFPSNLQDELNLFAERRSVRFGSRGEFPSHFCGITLLIHIGYRFLIGCD